MKRIKMLNLHTEENETIPTNEFETHLLKRRCFNEGWYKGLIMGAGAILAGKIIGEILCITILKSKDEA